ncbi:MAG: gliding motility-associated ABC transporter permease subunit GldF [Bacteroidia bacterium]|nr:gliding motility-associated ABC transporter permease subunit GldF [Bacteroidia bacterium]
MLTIFRKEVASFFNSLIAYLVIGAFLTGAGLFFWLFEMNVLETGVASMDILFDIGPYLFLFLVPAITMRSFSEEMKTGTIELLVTKPLQDWQIITGKYLATVFLVLFSLLPTLIYYFTIYFLGKPAGNLDQGAIWGAYIGLFFLGSIFAAIGLFTSSLTDNQIVAFILGICLCFFLFLAFDFSASIPFLSSVNHILIQIGIMEHYRSISRGVIDTRDIVYFISTVTIFLLLTSIVLNGKKK